VHARNYIGQAQIHRAEDRILSSSVLHVIGSLRVGGAERACVGMCNGLARFTGWKVHLLTLGPGLDLASAVDPEVELHLNVRARMRSFPIGVGRMASILANNRVDIVHAHLWHSKLFAIPSALLTGTRIVTTEHGRNPWKSRMQVNLERSMGRFIAARVVVSRRLLEERVERGDFRREKARVIYNPVDPIRSQSPFSRTAVREMLGIPEEAFLFVWVGRMVECKDLPRLLSSFRRLQTELPADMPNPCMVMVGDGPERLSAEAMPERIAARDNIVFTGFRSDVSDICRAGNCFILPSRTEGLSMAMLEAMLEGLPALATDVGGTSEALVDGVTGLLLDRDDRGNDHLKMLRMMKDPAETIRMGKAAREWVISNASLESTVKQLSELYSEVIS